MSLRSKLGVDLSGKLRAWRKRYRSSYHAFDYSRVECVVSAQGDRWKVTALCYCSDPHINGFSMDQMARVYESRRFPSRVEADAHLETEVRTAALRHPESRFYRYRELAYVQDGVVQKEPLTVCERYDGAAWAQVDAPHGTRRCQNCTYRTDEPICPKCGLAI